MAYEGPRRESGGASPLSGAAQDGGRREDLRLRQLDLLRGMQALPHLREPALAALGATEEELAASGDLAGAGLPRPVELTRYRLSLWPDYAFEFRHHPEQVVRKCLERAAFVRVAGAAPAADRHPEPWRILRDEMLAGSGVDGPAGGGPWTGVVPIDVWTPYESYAATSPVDGRRYFLRFGWGLLQEIAPLDVEPEPPPHRHAT
ncbi:hypothetical protein [Streptomyces sp. NPDC047718]|uniref:hypothetical protein n=1 Tax=Streptomyces sp. NPDC047718 TaxID=3155479 RepID=UPI0033DFA525